MLVKRHNQRHWLTPDIVTSTTSVLEKPPNINIAQIWNFSHSNQIPVNLSRKSNVDQERRQSCIVRKFRLIMARCIR